MNSFEKKTRNIIKFLILVLFSYIVLSIN
ncbi:hypothetical protein Eint_041635 [Encephalitozoon intestinalis ATCC 50506]|uniref:Uncharacterized protein n=1 Tax=Encephalitozoon intestinalis (strain ATCC 50506) TaxID=876142 RepID=W8P980_ENCIT|nr:hypothetical protein Eint_041635 [Encephalitozoon intestinalis ATCC 50506]